MIGDNHMKKLRAERIKRCFARAMKRKIFLGDECPAVKRAIARYALDIIGRDVYLTLG